MAREEALGVRGVRDGSGFAAGAVVAVVAPDGSFDTLHRAAADACRDGVGLHLVQVVPLLPGDSVEVRRAEATLSRAVTQARALVAGAVPVTSELFHGSLR